MNVCESSDWKACKGRLQVLDSEGVYRMNVCVSSDWEACKGRLQVLDIQGGI